MDFPGRLRWRGWDFSTSDLRSNFKVIFAGPDTWLDSFITCNERALNRSHYGWYLNLITNISSVINGLLQLGLLVDTFARICRQPLSPCGGDSSLKGWRKDNYLTAIDSVALQTRENSICWSTYLSKLIVLATFTQHCRIDWRFHFDIFNGLALTKNLLSLQAYFTGMYLFQHFLEAKNWNATIISSAQQHNI